MDDDCGWDRKKILSPMCTLQCNFLSLYFPFLLLKDLLYDHLGTPESGIKLKNDRNINWDIFHQSTFAQKSIHFF